MNEWTCTECDNIITPETMNPYLKSICVDCQESLTGGVFKENPYELKEDERDALKEIKGYLLDAVEVVDSILTTPNPFEDDTEFENLIHDFTNLDSSFGQNQEFLGYVKKIKSKIDSLEAVQE